MKRIKLADFPKDPFIDSPMSVAQAIKAARTQAGLRITDAAAMAGVAVQTFVDIEAGNPGVSIGKILQVADSMGVSFFAIPATSRDRIRHLLDSWTGGKP